MIAGRAQYKQGPVSVDGGWFAVVEGEWRQVPNPRPVSTAAPSTRFASEHEQGPVCVDGGWFTAVDGEWRQVPRPTFQAHSGLTIADGNVSVDDVHVLIEQRHS